MRRQLHERFSTERRPVVGALVMILNPANMNGARLYLSLTRRLSVPVVGTSSHRVFTRLPVKATTPATRRRRQIGRCFMNGRRVRSCCDTTRCRTSIVGLLRRRVFGGRSITLLANNDVVCVSTMYGNVSSVPAIQSSVHA